MAGGHVSLSVFRLSRSIIATKSGSPDLAARRVLEPSTVRPPEPATFVRMVCLGHHLDSLPEELREPYVVDVMKAYGEPMDLHYVRLNITARKSADV